MNFGKVSEECTGGVSESLKELVEGTLNNSQGMWKTFETNSWRNFEGFLNIRFSDGIAQGNSE